MKSLPEEFELFVSVTYRDQLPLSEVQLKGLRMAFYVGCFVTYERMIRWTLELSEDEAVKRLSALKTEIDFNMGTLACVPSHQ